MNEMLSRILAFRPIHHATVGGITLFLASFLRVAAIPLYLDFHHAFLVAWFVGLLLYQLGRLLAEPLFARIGGPLCSPEPVRLEARTRQDPRLAATVELRSFFRSLSLAVLLILIVRLVGDLGNHRIYYFVSRDLPLGLGLLVILVGSFLDAGRRIRRAMSEPPEDV